MYLYRIKYKRVIDWIGAHGNERLFMVILNINKGNWFNYIHICGMKRNLWFKKANKVFFQRELLIKKLDLKTKKQLLLIQSEKSTLMIQRKNQQ